MKNKKKSYNDTNDDIVAMAVTVTLTKEKIAHSNIHSHPYGLDANVLPSVECSNEICMENVTYVRDIGLLHDILSHSLSPSSYSASFKCSREILFGEM